MAIGYIIKHVSNVGTLIDKAMAYSVGRSENRPSTPEGERARIKAADHLERLQMTNPDEN